MRMRGDDEGARRKRQSNSTLCLCHRPHMFLSTHSHHLLISLEFHRPTRSDSFLLPPPSLTSRGRHGKPPFMSLYRGRRDPALALYG